MSNPLLGLRGGVAEGPGAKPLLFVGSNRLDAAACGVEVRTVLVSRTLCENASDEGERVTGPC